jgi:Sulfotransferase family
MNPYVFLVGCLRSGTTLLERIVGSHAQIAVIAETQWVPRWYERRLGLTPDGIVTPELVRRLCGHPRFPRLELDPARVAALVENDQPKHYAHFVTELFDLHGHVKGKFLVGEKSPGYVRHVPTLHALWPEAKFVHLIRDGRDVALSVLDWRKGKHTAGRFPMWDEDPVTTTALWWEWHVRLGREAGALLGPERYYELRYESLVAHPETECAKLCDFLAVPYDAAMLRFHEGRIRPKPGRSAKSAWLPVTPGLRSWRDDMDPNDIGRFEAVTRALLDELGYARVTAAASSADRRRAARLRDAFASQARARHRPVPVAWEDVAA